MNTQIDREPYTPYLRGPTYSVVVVEMQSGKKGPLGLQTGKYHLAGGVLEDRITSILLTSRGSDVLYDV